MEIKVHAIDMGLSPRLEEYINRKVDRLDKYLSNIIEANLELHKEGRSEQPVAQLTIRDVRGTIFRVEEKKQTDFFATVDVVVDRMQRQLSRYKKKKSRRGTRVARVEAEVEMLPLEELEIFEDEEEPEGKILRRKEILLTPMYEEEAVDQMELLGHDFFVYQDGDSGKVSVLYKRRDGNYGLIVTDK
ncbi:MAG: ribosome-associated translation inhibitor RaiA [Chloroflexi bacterium]|nr:ribosome-associated translation inhibitor RaiA [Chloroflexota bacterium]